MSSAPVALAAVLLAVVSVSAGYWVAERVMSPPLDDGLDHLPALELVDLNGGPAVDMSQIQGPAVINFWASWCAPCIEEVPILNELSTRHQIVGIALDQPQAIVKFTDEVPIEYQSYQAPMTAIGVLRALGNPSGALPFTLLIDRQGQITERYLGLIKPEQIDRAMARLQDQ